MSALFLGGLPGRQVVGEEVICGILARMILPSVFLMTVALEHHGLMRGAGGPGWEQRLRQRLRGWWGCSLYTIKEVWLSF